MASTDWELSSCPRSPTFSRRPADGPRNRSLYWDLPRSRISRPRPALRLVSPERSTSRRHPTPVGCIDSSSRSRSTAVRPRSSRASSRFSWPCSIEGRHPGIQPNCPYWQETGSKSGWWTWPACSPRSSFECHVASAAGPMPPAAPAPLPTPRLRACALGNSAVALGAAALERPHTIELARRGASPGRTARAHRRGTAATRAGTGERGRSAHRPVAPSFRAV